jgi:Immunity protein 74
MISDVSRWGFRLHIGNRTIKIEGEMLIPTPGLSDYIIFASSVTKWDAPYDNDVIDDATKQTILQTASSELSKLGWVPEIE